MQSKSKTEAILKAKFLSQNQIDKKNLPLQNIAKPTHWGLANLSDVFSMGKH